MAHLSERGGGLVSRLHYLVDWGLLRYLNGQYARLHRARLNGVTFVGITGSAGKTSAKVMIGAVLAAAGQVKCPGGGGNRVHHLARAIRETRPSDDFCVLELGAEHPGLFDRMVTLVQPTIGVVTTVGEDHFNAFRSREAIAAEKGKLIAALTPQGTAVLNADDPLVWGMRERFGGRVVSFGLCESADVRARDIRSEWPERLCFTVSHAGEDHAVRTQFCGTHWVTSTLAALATGVAAGVPLATAAAAIAEVRPPKARMEPATTPDGVTFIRDDWKAPYWAMPTVFDFLRDAKAPRKILVIGTLSDYEGSARIKYRTIGRQALQVADVVMFVGSQATLGLRAQKHAPEGKTLMTFPDIREASAALQEILRPGDLVVLKGSGIGDHLGRLYHAHLAPIGCWRKNCGKMTLCDGCVLLRPKDAPPVAAATPVEAPDAEASDAGAAAAPSGILDVLVGIGNPGEQYRGSPHNVGFAVLDILAERFGLAWEKLDGAEIARLRQPEGETLLVKPQKNVNNTGRVLLTLSKALGFAGDRCVLVHDDIQLPIGTVRSRLKGSDGGHLGVRSALVAFQTGDIRRVKIGVGLAENRLPPMQYLIAPLPAAAAEDVSRACAVAADRVMQLVQRPATGGARPCRAAAAEGEERDGSGKKNGGPRFVTIG